MTGKSIPWFALLLLLPAAAGADASFEGTWSTCVVEMAGRRNPYSVQTIRSEGGELKVFAEWGTKYSFIGTARVEGKTIVIRGCPYYVDQPMDCDPARPPVSDRLKLPMHKKPPANLDAALRRGQAIAITSPAAFNLLAARCEEVVDAVDAEKARR